jgi:hypothetical protein
LIQIGSSYRATNAVGSFESIHSDLHCLGSFVSTESIERRPDLGFGSYDRFFPNQDTLPHGGFGNLIALPLQKEPRDLGNSVFLDDQTVPYGDQWAFLSSVTRIGGATIEDFVREPNGEDVSSVYGCHKMEEDDPEPWTAPPSRRRKEAPVAGDLPDTLDLVVGNEIYINTSGCRAAAWRRRSSFRRI